jgi:adenosine deaminase
MKLSLAQKRPNEFYQTFPKVELHRHLEGSLRFETVRELARRHGMDLPATAELRTLVQVQDDEPFTFENFLSKFTTLRLFYRSPEVIHRITREAIEDAAADNIRYMEMRFTPVALGRAEGFPLADVMDWVIDATKQAEEEFNIKTRLIASVNRHESATLAAQVSYLAVDRMHEGIVGLDLAGDESNFSAEPFAEIFHAARQSGLGITVHAGEWNTGENVAQAVELLEADRIGHGIRVLESEGAIQMTRERNIPFEVCITSNYQSGAVSNVDAHPITQMLALGLNATINTDDPSISQLKLSDEYRLVCEVLGLSIKNLQERVIAAAQAAFLLEDEKIELINSLQKEYLSL